MKKLLVLLILCAASFAGYAQSLPIDSASQKITFQEVVRVNGSTKDELFDRAHKWFAANFSAPEEMIQTDDNTAGKIIAKGNFHDSYKIFLKPNPYTVYYTMSITVKEGRYRYEITDFTAQDNITEYNKNPKPFSLDAAAHDPKNKNAKGEYKGDLKNYLQAVSSQGAELAKSLKTALFQAPVNTKSKDDF